MIKSQYGRFLFNYFLFPNAKKALLDIIKQCNQQDQITSLLRLNGMITNINTWKKYKNQYMEGNIKIQSQWINKEQIVGQKQLLKILGRQHLFKQRDFFENEIYLKINK